MRTIPCLLLTCLAAFAGEREAILARLAETRSAGARPLVAFPEVQLDLEAARPVGLRGIPKLTGEARYAVARLGPRRLSLAFDAPGGAFALGQIFTGAAEPAVGRARTDGQKGLLVDFHDVAAGGTYIDVRLRYQGTRLLKASLIPARHRRGQVPLGGALRDLASTWRGRLH